MNAKQIKKSQNSAQESRMGICLTWWDYLQCIVFFFLLGMHRTLNSNNLHSRTFNIFHNLNITLLKMSNKFWNVDLFSECRKPAAEWEKSVFDVQQRLWRAARSSSLSDSPALLTSWRCCFQINCTSLNATTLEEGTPLALFRFLNSLLLLEMGFMIYGTDSNDFT